jgi:hypothetical protein
MTPNARPRSSYWDALRQPSVWRRAARLGLVVGVLQVGINQGDHWLRHEITPGVVLKTILSPLLSFAIAFLSAAATHAENSQHPPAPPST